jgi:integrase/recombinase XerD
MTHNFATVPARSRRLPRASRAPHSTMLLSSMFSEKIQITTAMRLLHAGVDTTVIALWLGHQQVATTQIYLHADLAIKERALARTRPPNTKPGRYRAADTLIAFLECL